MDALKRLLTRGVPSLAPRAAVDIVTEVDKGVEKMVSGRLAAAFPSFAFMGEETYKPGVRLGPEPTFVVDPIDGALSLSPLPVTQMTTWLSSTTTAAITTAASAAACGDEDTKR